MYLNRRVFVMVCNLELQIKVEGLGKKRADLFAFCAFVCFVHVGLCLYPLPLDVLDWLQLVIVALPYFSFYLFVE